MLMIREVVEILFGFGLAINAASFIPQIIKLVQKKNSSDISILTFIGFTFVQFVTIWHGYFIKDYTLMIGFSAATLATGTIIYLILRYRSSETNKDVFSTHDDKLIDGEALMAND